MIHNFYRYDIDLEFYQTQEIPQAIVPYEERFERSLRTEIQRFQKELNWSEMWDTLEVYARLLKGYKFWVLRPKNQIKGWAWLAPDGEIKNVYVSKWFRNQHWGRYLVLQCMNEAALSMEKVYSRVDIWNEPSKQLFEGILKTVSCKSKITSITENY